MRFNLIYIFVIQPTHAHTAFDIYNGIVFIKPPTWFGVKATEHIGGFINAIQFCIRIVCICQLDNTKYKLSMKFIFFNHFSMHSEIYIVHWPTNALFIKLGKV